MSWLGESGVGNEADKEASGQMIGATDNPSRNISIKLATAQQKGPVRKPGQANIKPTSRGFARMFQRRAAEKVKGGNQADGFHPSVAQLMGEGLPQ